MAKQTATTAPKPKTIGKLNEGEVREWFRTPDRFLAFLKRLPPTKVIEHPDLSGKGYDEPVTPTRAAYWTALSWFFRDAQALPRDQGPDHVLGAEATHFYGAEPPSKLQPILLVPDWGWIFALWHALDNRADRRSIQAARLALVVQEQIDLYQGLAL